MDSKTDYRQDGYHKGFTDSKRTGGKTNKTNVDNYLKYQTQSLSPEDSVEFMKAWHEGFADGVIGVINNMDTKEGLLKYQMDDLN